MKLKDNKELYNFLKNRYYEYFHILGIYIPIKIFGKKQYKKITSLDLSQAGYL